MSNITEFINSIEVPNTQKVVKHVLGDVEEIIDSYNCQELETFILNQKPNSQKGITTICYVIGLYARWLEEHNLADETLNASVRSLDKSGLWKKAKPRAKKKYISYHQYCRVLKDIEMYEEFNALYYATLFKCIYEGIYSDDMSVLKNLRASDINGNRVTLHEDNGHTYDLKISDGLALDLKKLAEKDTWERKNRYGICKVRMRESYFDSAFKVEYRKTSAPDAAKFSYYAKLRKISDDYLENKILPLQLYVSGVMHRIILALEARGISIEEAFAENSRNRYAYEIISAELRRCNYTADIANFREMVKGHLDSFCL